MRIARRAKSAIGRATLDCLAGGRTALLKRSVALAALLFAITVIAVAASCGASFAAERPNILFILADDLGWIDLGCYGSTFDETPNIDKLARQGMRFTCAYSAGTVCSPTRSSLMTGKYPVRTGITDYIPGLRPTD